ncbi:MAG TPA: cold shock domain-containing protein [Candidatus Angelobacter sp.]|nr:cold shock domain-containing protein [Candidatus Angelobacter sp.]
MSDVKIKSKVKWFDQIKGFGFLKVEGRDKDVFFHAKQWNAAKLGRLPIEGEDILFTEKSGEKGLFATDIQKP